MSVNYLKNERRRRLSLLRHFWNVSWQPRCILLCNAVSVMLGPIREVYYMYSSKGYNQITSPYFPWRYTTLFCLSIAAFFFVFFPLLLSLFFLFLLLSTTLYSYKSLQKTASAPFGATLILSWLLLCVSLGFFFLRGSPTLWFQCKLLPLKSIHSIWILSEKSHFSRDQNSRIQAWEVTNLVVVENILSFEGIIFHHCEVAGFCAHCGMTNFLEMD